MAILSSIPIRQAHSFKKHTQSKDSEIEQTEWNSFLIGMNMLTKGFKVPK